ncbi:MAG: hypothetical protein KGS48_09230 [Bacteroidetes bacterium]|nr:hypothetical protein [Bacteroidota bacterium]
MFKILFPFLLGCSWMLHAQHPKGLQDPATDWAAMVDLTFQADPLASPEFWRKESSLSILKLSAEQYGIRDLPDFSLNSKLWQAARSGQWEMYADAELTRPLAFEDALKKFMRPDTSITFDPETYEERVSINLESKRLPFEAPLVRVRQLLTYHNTTASFSIQTLAIAPCWEDEQPPYWMKLPNYLSVLPESVLDAPDISWGIRYTTEGNSPTEDRWIELKNTTGPLLHRFLDRIRLDTSITLYDAEENVVSNTKRPCLFSCFDTIRQFDPQTFKEHVQVVETGIDLELLHDLQLIETWFWDKSQNNLIIRLWAVAPRVAMNRPGDELQMQARFFRKCEEE